MKYLLAWCKVRDRMYPRDSFVLMDFNMSRKRKKYSKGAKRFLLYTVFILEHWNDLPFVDVISRAERNDFSLYGLWAWSTFKKFFPRIVRDTKIEVEVSRHALRIWNKRLYIPPRLVDDTKIEVEFHRHVLRTWNKSWFTLPFLDKVTFYGHALRTWNKRWCTPPRQVDDT